MTKFAIAIIVPHSIAHISSFVETQMSVFDENDPLCTDPQWDYYHYDVTKDTTTTDALLARSNLVPAIITPDGKWHLDPKGVFPLYPHYQVILVSAHT